MTKKLTNIRKGKWLFDLKATAFIVAFIVGGNMIANVSGITEQISNLVYIPMSDGSVAGEYDVRIAATGASYYEQYLFDSYNKETTFEQRKQAFITDNGDFFIVKNDHKYQALWAMLENNDSRASVYIDELVNYAWHRETASESAAGYRVLVHPNASPSDKQKVYNRYVGDIKNCAEKPDVSVFEYTVNPNHAIQVASGLYVFLSNNPSENRDIIYKYNTGSTGWKDFCYDGRCYQYGGSYDFLQFLEDYLQYRYDWYMSSTFNSLEFDTRIYYWTHINASLIVYDYAAKQTMRDKAKMVTDFLLLDMAMDYSANQWGGKAGSRETEKYYTLKKDNTGYQCILLGVSCGFPGAYKPSYNVYLTNYRVPALIYDVAHIEDEPDDYWHLHKEYNANTHYGNTGKQTFVTKYFNIGGGYEWGWLLNIKSDDKDGDKPIGKPFRLWLNSPGSSAPGGRFAQYNNAVVVDSGSTQLYFYNNTKPANPSTWDYYEEDGGRYIMQKGKTMVIAEPGGIVEAQVQGVNYNSIADFKAAFVGGNTTSMGDTITLGNSAYVFPYDRMETIDNNGSKIIDWTNKVMTVSRHGKKCTYNFNSWQTSGDCGGGSITPTQTCGAQGGTLCNAGEDCGGGMWLGASDTNYCCSGICKAGGVCTPDGCNGVCPSGCTASDDLDCDSTGCCGDGTCDSGENNTSCSSDCGITGCPYNKCSTGDTCNNWYNSDPTGLCCIATCNSTGGTTTNFYPSYPKVMRHGAGHPQSSNSSSDYSDGAMPMIWSKYDVVAFSTGDFGSPNQLQFSSEIKKYDPTTIVLGIPGSIWKMPNDSPDDYLDKISGSPTESFFGHQPDGTIPVIYRNPMPNYTKKRAGEFAITNSGGTGLYDKFTKSDFTNFDGVFYPDGRSAFHYSELCNNLPNIDFDENGVGDTSEYGNNCSSNNIDEINMRWRAGYDARMKKERETAVSISGNNSFKIVINDGGEPIGDIYGNGFKNLVDGFMFENAPRDKNRLIEIILDWDENGKKPSLVNWVDTIGREMDDWRKDGQNDFQKMRYHLATSMLGDVYYGLCLGQGNMVCFWYDEFELELGQPIVGGRHTIDKYCKDPCPDPGWGCAKNCPYVRFFDNGAVIVNTTGENINIDVNDINSLQGYNGPYYKFIGGQDPTTNNGQELGSVSLAGTFKVDSNGSKIPDAGDGILLVKQPNQYVVSDILVGNGRHDDTSPGSKPVITMGNWQEEWLVGDMNGKGNPYYVQYLADWLEPDINDGYPAVWTDDKNATAKFVPTVGVPGEYEVYEWHGWHGASGGDDEADNVGFRVEINGSEIDSGKIDQTTNYGQWNLLGTYIFPAGSNSFVELSASGTNGVVIADVMMFRFTGNSSGSPSPNKKGDTNCDNKVDIIDVGIMMSCWGGNVGVNYPGCADEANPPACQSPDLDNSDEVDVTDFGILLSNWG